MVGRAIMRITRDTLVKAALESSPRAAEIFARYGVDPRIACRSSFDITTIAEAEDECGLEALDELIAELNAACANR